MIDLEIKDYIFICNSVKEILKEQPMLLNLEAPIKICGKKLKIILKEIYMDNIMIC